MEFRLTYEGQLLADNAGRNLQGRASHKHDIRKKFHSQLKVLWSHHPALKALITTHHYTHGGKTIFEKMTDNFREFGYRFAPLVTRENCLLCKVEILMLRQGEPGAVISAGDLDNRLKTLFDALKKPKVAAELGGALPDADEDPFFCLLEDDGLITHAAIETDTLLQSVTGDVSDVRVVITVTVRPYGGPALTQDFL